MSFFIYLYAQSLPTMKPHLEIVPQHDTKLLIKKEYLMFMEINWHIHPEY